MVGPRQTAGQHDHVEGIVQYRVEFGVGHQLGTAAAAHQAFVQAGANHFDAGAAQQIDDGYCFEFFATVCEGDEDACHDCGFLW